MSLAVARCAVEPDFLAGPAARLFAIHYRPVAPVEEIATLIYVPPFAEEMNRARRMVALQARALAARGVGVLVLDLYGTGDSDGDFADARWEIWHGDIAAAAAWLERRGAGRLGLWGLRLGAVLACEAAARDPARYAQLLLWHPVVEGNAMLTQFLRIRVAAAMGGDAPETTQSLRAALAAGRAVEIAGYEVAPALAEAVDRARIAAPDLPGGIRVNWLDVGDEAAAHLPESRQRIVDAWRQRGIAAAAAQVAGEPFWALQETTVAPRLLEATDRLFTG